MTLHLQQVYLDVIGFHFHVKHVERVWHSPSTMHGVKLKWISPLRDRSEQGF